MADPVVLSPAEVADICVWQGSLEALGRFDLDAADKARKLARLLSHVAALTAARDETPKPTVPNPCSICGVPIFGSTIGTGDGSMRDGGSFAHPECYYRNDAKELRAALRAAEQREATLREALEKQIWWIGALRIDGRIPADCLDIASAAARSALGGTTEDDKGIDNLPKNG